MEPCFLVKNKNTRFCKKKRSNINLQGSKTYKIIIIKNLSDVNFILPQEEETEEEVILVFIFLKRKEEAKH